MGFLSETAAASGGSLSFIPSLLIVGIIGLAIYFIPSLVAYKKQHIQKQAILILNIFLGWTFIGWVVALIWSVTKRENTP